MFSFKKKSKGEIYKFGIGGGILEIIYILLVAWFITVMGETMDKENTIFSILAFLLLFVFSAAISGVFVMGYPAYLGLQKKLHEAILTLLTTLMTMFICGIIIFLIVIFVR